MDVNLTTDLLTQEQAAALLHVKPDTLTVWRHRRQGPKFVRIGKRRIAYLRQQVTDFVLGGMAA